jgi:hypothetical protein
MSAVWLVTNLTIAHNPNITDAFKKSGNKNTRTRQLDNKVLIYITKRN